MGSSEIDRLIREKRLYFVGEKLPNDWYEAFRVWLPLAEAGDVKAQFNIGRCYSLGDGVDVDKSKAYEWLSKAGNNEEPRALFNLALMYEEGEFVDKNQTKADELIDNAAKLGEVRAICRQASNSLATGDIAMARQQYKRAADLGSIDGKMGLIVCDIDIDIDTTSTTHYGSPTLSVVNGTGFSHTPTYRTPTIIFNVTNKSPSNAHITLWIEEFGPKNTKCKLDSYSIDLDTVMPGQTYQSTKDIFKADDRTIFLTGLTIWHNGRSNSTKSYSYFGLSKRQIWPRLRNKPSKNDQKFGDPHSSRSMWKPLWVGLVGMLILGLIVNWIEGPNRIRNKAALEVAMYELLPLSAEPSVKARIGVAYLNDVGFNPSVEKAMRWLEPAAEEGDLRALVVLGGIYENGKVGQKDYRRAFDYYQMAALRGDAHAQLKLAEYYQDGKGVRKNLALAFAWYEIGLNGQTGAWTDYDKQEIAKKSRRVFEALSSTGKKQAREQLDELKSRITT